MREVNWREVIVEDLKDNSVLVKNFRKYLKKECGYSTEEARFACDGIDNPFGKHSGVQKVYVTTEDIDGVTFEIYQCSVQDSSDKPFEFYMLIDRNTLQKKDEAWFSYYLAKKKYYFI